jgi:SAM-dependent methyltransferase
MGRKNMVRWIERLRPEASAGGFARDDGGVQFFTRVNALLSPSMTVLDLGAGRGTVFQTGVDSYYERLARLQGKAAKVIGVDVDRGILEHPHLDERHVISPTEPLPLADVAVDLIVCDWVLEHVADPHHFTNEVARVLRPGGWFCARTPNRWGYVGMAVRMIPNSLHKRLLRGLQPNRVAEDVFPTQYKMNSRKSISKLFPHPHWIDYTYTNNPTPKYFGKSRVLFSIIDLYQSSMPNTFKTDLLVFLRKR